MKPNGNGRRWHRRPGVVGGGVRCSERLLWIATVVSLLFLYFSANQRLLHIRSNTMLDSARFYDILDRMSSSSESNDRMRSDYSMAYEESLGFFRDIPERAWLRRKAITHSRIHVGVEDPFERIFAPAWYQQNWDPDFACFYEDEIGGNQDGHKWVCDPHRLRQYPNDCLVYSFGSNNEFSFETHLQRIAPNCEIHIFDPTDYSRELQQQLQQQQQEYPNTETTRPPNITYHAWGLQPTEEAHNADEVFTEIGNTTAHQIQERNQRRVVQFKTLDDTLRELGHTGRRIDIFKIDCEGCEYETYRDFLRADLRQILIEVHEQVHMTQHLFQDIHDAGYVLFHKEPNIQHGSGKCVEFSFLKLGKKFFS